MSAVRTQFIHTKSFGGHRLACSAFIIGTRLTLPLQHADNNVEGPIQPQRDFPQQQTKRFFDMTDTAVSTKPSYPSKLAGICKTVHRLTDSAALAAYTAIQHKRPVRSVDSQDGKLISMSTQDLGCIQNSQTKRLGWHAASLSTTLANTIPSEYCPCGHHRPKTIETCHLSTSYR